MNTFIEEQSLKNIDIQDVRAYLLQKRWRHVPYEDTRLEVFVHREGEGKSNLLMLPIDPELTDFYPRLLDALAVLAKVEQTPVYMLMQTLSVVTEALKKMRLELSEGQMPSMSLVAQFLQGLYELLVATAHVELVGVSRYFARTSDDGKNEASQFHFGHTNPGSFVFNVASPPIQQTLFEDHAGVERRMVERITRGLIFAERAESVGNASLISEQYSSGMNGNMCYATANMLEGLQGTKVEYSVDWSPRKQPSVSLSQSRTIRLDSQSAVYLRQAGNVLKETSLPGTEELGERDIHGSVLEMKQEGEARFIMISSANYQQSIRAEILQDADYRKAATAHVEKRPISIRGLLVKRRKNQLLLLNAREILLR